MPSLPLRVLHVLLPASLIVCVACQEEEPDPRGFDENGTWSLQEWADNGSDFQDLSKIDVRRDSFFLKFSEAKGTVAAAACSSPLDDPPDYSPYSSRCRGGSDDEERLWDCKCFSYDWRSELSQVWLQFEPGGGKPPNPNTADESKVTMVDADEMDVANTIRLSPLPAGAFSSDGSSSVYLLQKKSDNLFDESGCWEECVGG
ncbi:MAG: hypothetical protein B7733_19265 [Myxococcales bacterium FL481]|nr:MAG: hypothetical protein B7733_19265 [Myxococcales bacterium FL481]